MLLKDTSRLDEAEPLLRRSVEILRTFEKSTSLASPNMDLIMQNYRAVLAAMGRAPTEFDSRVIDAHEG